MDKATDTPLIPWMLSFLRPHRGRVSLLAVLLLSEIGLGALQPWALAIAIDHVLGGKPFRPSLQPIVNGLTHGSRFELLIVVVVAGVVLQVVNQFVSAYGTQVQVDTGQRMVYDLRYQLFEHLQALGLHHHITTSTGDAVYRVDVDAYSIENLVMSGIFPLATSVTTLVVMFSILAYKDLTIALLSLDRRAVPVSLPALLHVDARQPRGARQGARVEAARAALRDVLGDAARQELRARAVRSRALRQGRRKDDERADRASRGSSRCSRSSSARSRFSAPR